MATTTSTPATNPAEDKDFMTQAELASLIGDAHAVQRMIECCRLRSKKLPDGSRLYSLRSALLLIDTSRTLDDLSKICGHKITPEDLVGGSKASAETPAERQRFFLFTYKGQFRIHADHILDAPFTEEVCRQASERHRVLHCVREIARRRIDIALKTADGEAELADLVAEAITHDAEVEVLLRQALGEWKDQPEDF